MAENYDLDDQNALLVMDLMGSAGMAMITQSDGFVQDTIDGFIDYLTEHPNMLHEAQRAVPIRLTSRDGRTVEATFWVRFVEDDGQ